MSARIATDDTQFYGENIVFLLFYNYNLAKSSYFYAEIQFFLHKHQSLQKTTKNYKKIYL